MGNQYYPYNDDVISPGTFTLLQGNSVKVGDWFQTDSFAEMTFQAIATSGTSLISFSGTIVIESSLDKGNNTSYEAEQTFTTSGVKSNTLRTSFKRANCKEWNADGSQYIVLMKGWDTD
jgi:hypothetical protein